MGQDGWTWMRCTTVASRGRPWFLSRLLPCSQGSCRASLAAGLHLGSLHHPQLSKCITLPRITGNADDGQMLALTARVHV